MSKKKATMTLKDFHGGSIPSDLPLPSAPGVIARPPDRGGYDRQTPWGNPMGKSDHRLRPGSAGGMRNFDDKTPFLSPGARIGRNFDEDERKPLDGGSGSRRTVSDDIIRALPTHVEPKVSSSSGGGVIGRPVSAPAPQHSSNPAGFSEFNHVGVNSQNFGGNSGIGVNSQNVATNSSQMFTGSYPNAWRIRKEVAGRKEPVSAAWSAPDAATKLATASALEKVSSGRWNSKQQIHPQPDVEVIKHQEFERESKQKGDSEYYKHGYNDSVEVGEKGYHDATLALHIEKSLMVDDGAHGEFPVFEKARHLMHMESNERTLSANLKGFQSPHSAGRSVGSELQSLPPSESIERPKLKLLPRSKPVENLEPSVEYKQGYLKSSDYDHVENYHQTHGTEIATNVPETGIRTVERPKLNLKPRTQPSEPPDAEVKRNMLFGGARPRELVLKERGVDEVALDNDDLQQSSRRSKQDAIKTEAVPMQTARYNGKSENITSDHRTGKSNDKREHRAEVERTDFQRRNRRGDNWRNKETENQHQQQPQQERPPSPETWRKPVESPKPASNDATGTRPSKVASAVELATAFSKSVSDPVADDRLSRQRGLPNRTQMPFSRLLGPAPRPQINGY